MKTKLFTKTLLSCLQTDHSPRLVFQERPKDQPKALSEVKLEPEKRDVKTEQGQKVILKDAIVMGEKIKNNPEKRGAYKELQKLERALRFAMVGMDDKPAYGEAAEKPKADPSVVKDYKPLAEKAAQELLEWLEQNEELSEIQMNAWLEARQKNPGIANIDEWVSSGEGKKYVAVYTAWVEARNKNPQTPPVFNEWVKTSDAQKVVMAYDNKARQAARDAEREVYG